MSYAILTTYERFEKRAPGRFAFVTGLLLSFYGIVGDYTTVQLSRRIGDYVEPEKTFGSPNLYSKDVLPFFFVMVYVIVINILSARAHNPRRSNPRTTLEPRQAASCHIVNVRVVIVMMKMMMIHLLYLQPIQSTVLIIPLS